MKSTAFFGIHPGSAFVRNVMKVSSGKFGALIIAILATPIISRLFLPEDYGVAAVFVAYSGVLGSLLPLGYARAIIFPKEDLTARRLLSLVLAVSAALMLIAYIVMVIGSLIWPDIAARSGMGAAFWLFPIGALMVALRDIYNSLALRRDDFGAVATAVFATTAVTALTRILWGLLLASSVVGLLAGHLIGLLVGVVVCLVRAIPWLRSHSARSTWAELKNVAIEFRDYPIYRAPAKVAFEAGRSLPVIALGFMFPAEVAGFFAMANRAVNRPLRAGSQSITDVLVRRTLRISQKQKPLVPGLLKVGTILMLIGVPIFVVLFFFGQELMALFLSERWRSAGVYVEIMCPYLFTIWVGAWAPTVFETMRLNSLRLRLNLADLVLRICLFSWCAISAADVIETLWTFVILCTGFQVLVMLIAARAAMSHDASLARSTEGAGS